MEVDSRLGVRSESNTDTNLKKVPYNPGSSNSILIVNQEDPMVNIEGGVDTDQAGEGTPGQHGGLLSSTNYKAK